MPIGILHIHNLELFGKHGYYEEERVLGGTYRWNVRIKLHHALFSENTEEKDIYNYEDVVAVVKRINEKPEAFIERLCSKVYEEVNNMFPNNQGVEVVVEKQNVPINRLESTIYTISNL